MYCWERWYLNSIQKCKEINKMVKEIIGKKGKVYLMEEVGTFSVPEQYKGKFLFVDSKTGMVFYKYIKPKTEAEKNAAKEARLKQVKAKYAEQNKINATVNKELDSNLVRLREVTKTIKKNVLIQDITGLQAERTVLLSRIDELRAKKKSVPKKYR